MLKSPLRIAAALAALSLPSCSTSVLQPRSPSAGPWRGTAILLNYDLLNADGTPVSDSCDLVLNTGGKDVTIVLPGRSRSSISDHVLVDAPAGHYNWKSLSCSHFTRWVLDALSGADFTVAAGKIDFVGRITFRFPKSGAAQQVLTTEMGRQGQATQSLAIDLLSLPAGWASSIENPYTGKPITREMLAPKGIYRMQLHFSQQLKPGIQAVSTRVLHDALNRCDQEEQRRYPYRIGSLDDVAVYEDGKLQSFTRSGRNSFSDAFLSCIEAALRDFAPPAGVRLKASVTL